MFSKIKKNKTLTALIKVAWLIFFTSLVFLVDVKLIRYKLIGVELSLLLLFLLWFIKEYRKISEIIKEAVVLPFIALAVFYTFAYLFSPAGAAAYPEWQRMLFGVVAYILAYRLFFFCGADFLIGYITAIGGLVSLYGLLQVSGGIWILQVPKLGRIFATFGNPNFFASFLIGLIPVAAAFFIKKKRIWKFIALLFMVFALYYTKTRGAWMGITGAAILWYFAYGRKKIPSYAVVIIAGLIILFGFIKRDELNRDTQRLLIWKDSLKMAADNPVSGVGIGNYHNEFPAYASKELLKIIPQGKFIVNYAHNEFIDIFAETGITGFGIYIWLLATFFILNLKYGSGGYIKQGAFLGATAIIIHSFVSVNMRFTISSLWAFFLMGLSVGDIAGKYREKKEKINRYHKSYKVIAVILFALLLFFWARAVLTPLFSHKKLLGETDFFDTEREYSKRELKKLIESKPQNALIYYKLGWIQAKDREFQPAIKNFKKAIKLDDSLTGAFNNLGNIYFTLGKRNDAAKYYIEALKRNPAMPDAHFNLGYIYYYQGRLKEATREFNKVLKLDPENYKAKMMLDKMVQ